MEKKTIEKKLQEKTEVQKIIDTVAQGYVQGDVFCL